MRFGYQCNSLQVCQFLCESQIHWENHGHRLDPQSSLQGCFKMSLFPFISPRLSSSSPSFSVSVPVSVSVSLSLFFFYFQCRDVIFHTSHCVACRLGLCKASLLFYFISSFTQILFYLVSSHTATHFLWNCSLTKHVTGMCVCVCVCARSWK